MAAFTATIASPAAPRPSFPGGSKSVIGAGAAHIAAATFVANSPPVAGALLIPPTLSGGLSR